MTICSKIVANCLVYFFLSASIFTLVSCGGGGGGESTSDSSNPDITVTPPTFTPLPNIPPTDPDANPLDNFNVTISSSCLRQVRICVRDNACEDGDRVRVSVNGSVVFSGEIFNAARCVNVPVRQGTNSISMQALNGTGFKGSCSHADVNTGEIQIFGNNNVQRQQWSHRGGAGSEAHLVVNIGPQTTNCSLGGTQPPPGPPIGPQPPSGLPGAVFQLTDSCSDGLNIEYRFFQYDRWRDGDTVAGGSPTHVWPSNSQVYVTWRFGQQTESNLRCTAGKGVCYGARPENGQGEWGAGIEGTGRCTGCCVRCPTSGSVRLSRQLTCR